MAMLIEANGSWRIFLKMEVFIRKQQYAFYNFLKYFKD